MAYRVFRLTGLVLTLVCALTVVGWTRPARHPKAKINKIPGKLTFLRGDALWLLSQNGTTLRKLATVSNAAWPVGWDRTANRIAWADDQGLWVLDLRTGAKQKLTQPPTKGDFGSGHFDPWGTPAWDKTGRWLFIGGNISQDVDADGGVWQFTADNQTPPKQIISPSPSIGPAFRAPLLSPNGRYLFDVDVEDGQITAYLYNLQQQKYIPVSIPAILVQLGDYGWLPDNQTLAIGNFAGRYEKDAPPSHGGIWRFNPFTSQARPWLAKGKTIGPLALSPNGRLLAYALPGPHKLQYRIHDLRTGRDRCVLVATNYSPDRLSWAPDSRYLAASMLRQDATRYDIYIIDTQTGTLVQTIKDARAPSWSPR